MKKPGIGRGPALVVAILMITLSALVISQPTASAHPSLQTLLDLKAYNSVYWSPFATVYYGIYKQTSMTTTGYVVFVSTERIQHYLASFDNRIWFTGGVEYGGNCPGSTFVGYTPRDQQTSATCSGGVYGDIVGSGNGYFYITPGIPGGVGQKWRSMLSGDARIFWKEGGYTAWWSDLNVARAGYGLTTGEQISISVSYVFAIYNIFWWDLYNRGTNWYYTIP